MSPLVKSKFNDSNLNKKIKLRKDGNFEFRLKHVKSKYIGKKKHVKCPKLIVKCGDCDNKVEIYYDKDFLEINGVNGSLQQWKELFDKLLK